MHCKLIGLSTLHFAHLFGLVRSIELARVDDGRRRPWVLLVRGRGFNRILQDAARVPVDPLRQGGWWPPRPARFPTAAAARDFAMHRRLWPSRTHWRVTAAAKT